MKPHCRKGLSKLRIKASKDTLGKGLQAHRNKHNSHQSIQGNLKILQNLIRVQYYQCHVIFTSNFSPDNTDQNQFAGKILQNTCQIVFRPLPRLFVQCIQFLYFSKRKFHQSTNSFANFSQYHSIAVNSSKNSVTNIIFHIRGSKMAALQCACSVNPIISRRSVYDLGHFALQMQPH